SFVGETESTTFQDLATIAPDNQAGPPAEENPFFGPGNWPGAVGAYYQRRAFGGSLNKPDTTFYSRIGAFNNFSRSSPLRQDDAITAVLPATQVNEIRHLVTTGDLIVFTSGSEWSVSAGA